MQRKVWLINLFGTPAAPSSFCPDNSLAALAGSLKQAGYLPLIIDYQTINFCSELIPEAIGKKLLEIVQKFREGGEDEQLMEKYLKLQQQLEVHQDKVLDKLTHDLISLQKKENPLFIGFKLYSGEGHYLTSELVKKLKAKNWSTKIVGGGPLLRVLGKDYFECFDGFDYLLDGEAERSIVKLAKYLENKSSFGEIPGLIYSQNGKIHAHHVDMIENINELPNPAYDKEIYPALYEKNQKARIFQIDDSRGCPNRCSFCIHPNVNGNIVRCRHSKEIVKHMRELQNTFGAFCFRFTGSNTPKKLLEGVTNELLDLKMDIRYSCYASVNMTSIQEIKKFKAAGLCGLFIGVESLDDKVISDIFKKRQNTEQAKNLVIKCLDAGIYTTTSWIYPAPGQGKDAEENIYNFLTSAYAGKSADEGSVMLIPPAVVPNTDWFRSPEEFGFHIPDRKQLVKNYAKLRLNLHTPRRLIGKIGYESEGLSCSELKVECDKFQLRLAKKHLPLNITDDWMLMGKLSSMTVDDFQNVASKCLISGNYQKMESVIETINLNSSLKIWNARDKKISA